MKVFKKAVLPKDFLASGVSCGIKKSGKPDLALLYSRVPAQAAAAFTSNTIQAAPVQVCKLHLGKRKVFRAIVANSGNANCFTGPEGIQDALQTAQVVSGELGVDNKDIFVASTGIIGKRLPLSKIVTGIPYAVRGLSRDGIHDAKKAIMTTDTFAKEIAVRFMHEGRPVTICGIAKGAGMISPTMATMLAFILTDAVITRRALSKALKAAVNESFNCITVDGCMSTNDTVIVMANGGAKTGLIDNASQGYGQFAQGLNTVCLELAKMIVRDGEGATKFIAISVTEARSFAEARAAALSIANSNLFKTAVYGETPNYGRIVAALGATGIATAEKDVRVHVSSLHKRDISVHVSLNIGSSSATVYTCDLTPEYIKINAEYS